MYGDPPKIRPPTIDAMRCPVTLQANQYAVSAFKASEAKDDERYGP